MSKRRRRRKGGGGGGPGGGHGGGGGGSWAPIMTLTPGSVPTDEQLEMDLRQLEEESGGKLKAAKKEDLDLAGLQKMSGEELVKLAKKEGLEDQNGLSKQRLVFEILKRRAQKHGLMTATGTLDLMHEGYGFLRSSEYSYLASPDDIYVSPAQVRRHGLRKGQVVTGLVRPPKDTEIFFSLLRVDQVNGKDPKALHDLPAFEALTPLHPNKRIHLEML
ncbi:MAG: hypothetical protein EBQ99_11035, partial [Planctomycetes bacterium]|nr:hypothetical protein [Planctomycetota bacterium]